MLTGISRAITNVHERIEHHSVEHFKQYMDLETDESGELTHIEPKTISLGLPDQKGDFKPKEIPLVALTHLSSLQLDRITFNLAFKADWDHETGEMKVDVKDKKSILRHEESTPIQKIELVYNKESTPEGIGKILTEMTKKI
jgi:hypothetical protein